MNRKWLAGLILTPALALITSALSSTASAAQITLNATWQVWKLTDPNSTLGGTVQQGDTFLSTTVFESSIVDGDPSSLRGFYDHAISSVSFCGDGICFTSNDGSITVKNYGSSGYLFSQTAATNDGTTINSNTDLQPSFNDKLTWMETKPLRIDSSSASLYNGDFSIDLQQVGNFTYTIATPLPLSAWLFGSSLVALGGLARRRGSSRA